MSPCVIPDRDCPDGTQRGYAADGTLIVEMQLTPVFKRIIGTESDDRDVHTWRVSPQEAHRMRVVKAWALASYVCGGAA